MKKLYSQVLAGRGAGPEPATMFAVTEAEARLGFRLPTTYRAFAQAVGSTWWPVEVSGVEALRASEGAFGQPGWFVAFATDGFGNDWGWDTRVTGDELPVVFWDHEEPPSAHELATSDAVTPFDDWLEEFVDEASARDDADWWDDLARAIDLHSPGSAHVPAVEDVEAVEARLGRALPRDYVRFTLRFGSTEWPFTIVDAQEVEALTAELHRTHAGLADAIAFGRDRDGSFLAFRGERVVGPAGELAAGFRDLLEAHRS